MVAGNIPRAQSAFERLATECPDGIIDALIGWCDTVLAHINGGTWDFSPMRVIPMAVETGELGGDLEAPKQWAMDLIQARGNGDQAAFEALLRKVAEVPDGWERGRYGSALLEICAMSIRTLPSGLTRLGRS
ncbi:hypothetical protein GCM10010109_69470 [Actinoplanes campanulatus]|nr:hypothetical protein GCM10010109_69470 [Actinoplanes campanulatus]GID40656.1 hypothetical protein Aca09nite_71620 [Actinoplanes campanulatus]